MLELQGVSKAYGDTQALYPTSLVVQQGQTIALLGPSGCGKSTLLRIIVGLIQPDGGRVLLDNELVTEENIRQVRHRMGYMIQDGGLFPHLSLRDNMSLLARHVGWPVERT